MGLLQVLRIKSRRGSFTPLGVFSQVDVEARASDQRSALLGQIVVPRHDVEKQGIPARMFNMTALAATIATAIAGAADRWG
jgi:hypothetical protein